MAVATAAVLPAMVLAGRLQRDSAIATEAAFIAGARIELLKGRVADGATALGGSLDAGIDGWQAYLDRAGAEVVAARAMYECRWRLAESASPGVLIAAVRVSWRGQAGGAVTLSTAVHDE